MDLQCKHLFIDGMGIEHTFGLNIKEMRKAAGMSQEALALEMDVDQAYISRIEAGNKNLSIQTISRLAKALQTTPEALMKDCIG